MTLQPLQRLYSVTLHDTVIIDAEFEGR